MGAKDKKIKTLSINGGFGKTVRKIERLSRTCLNTLCGLEFFKMMNGNAVKYTAGKINSEKTQRVESNKDKTGENCGRGSKTKLRLRGKDFFRIKSPLLTLCGKGCCY
jgi:hypothetical protein